MHPPVNVFRGEFVSLTRIFWHFHLEGTGAKSHSTSNTTPFPQHGNWSVLTLHQVSRFFFTLPISSKLRILLQSYLLLKLKKNLISKFPILEGFTMISTHHFYPLVTLHFLCVFFQNYNFFTTTLPVTSLPDIIACPNIGRKLIQK